MQRFKQFIINESVFILNEDEVQEGVLPLSPEFIKQLQITFGDKKALDRSDKDKIADVIKKSSIENLKQLIAANIPHISNAAKNYIRNNIPGGIKQEVDEKNLATNIVSSIDNSIGDINAEIRLDTKNTNSNRIRFTFFIAADQREKYVTRAKELIDSNTDFNEIDVAPARVRKEFAFKADGVYRIIHIDTKPTGKRSATDPNELMTAAISCIKNLRVPTTVEEVDATIEKAKELVKRKVRDYKQSDLDAFEKDYTNTCQAVSAAIAIQKFIGGPADLAYMTGQKWGKDIAKFKSTAHGMKDFNSSDIVFKIGNKWFGISLKKKERLSEKDPTLINKAFGSILQSKEFSKLRTEIDQITAKFFISIIKEAIDKGDIKPLSKSGRIIKPTESTWKEYVGRLSTDYISKKLKGRESLFKDLANIVNSYSSEIANAIINIALKLDLKDLKKQDFYFALITGIGSYGPRKGVSIEEADLKDLDTILEKMNNLVSKGSPRIELDSRRTQAFEPNATAATLHYILKIGNMNILDINIRYKGRYTSQPSYMAMMTDEFKAYLKDR